LSDPSSGPVLQTPLHALHLRLGARMAPFAGYDMPIQYKAGIVAEHLHTREKAGLFDVSHMGQALLDGPDAAAKLETLVPGDIQGLAPGQIRYTQLLDANGNILDDLMVTRRAPSEGRDDTLFLVVNAACKTQDFALIASSLRDCRLRILDDRALLALQGPKAAAVLSREWPTVAAMPFMTFAAVDGDAHAGQGVLVSRSGYTGEDGYEISLPGAAGLRFAEHLLENPDVLPIGLGARDSLRLEAGLCLYGHDIDDTTDPIAAGLAWSIGKRRRSDGGFPGADRVRLALANGPDRHRVGLLLEGRAVAREGADIHAPDGPLVGRITSGGHSPSLNRPIAMGYVDPAHAKIGAMLDVMVRGKPIVAKVTRMPFVPHRYFRPAG
jgi:aminomethyltransferase